MKTLLSKRVRVKPECKTIKQVFGFSRIRKCSILLIGLVLGMGGGVGLAAVKESTDQTVRSAGELEKETAFPVLASIPVIATPEDLERGRSKWWYVGIGVLFFLASAVIAFSLLVTDLDALVARVWMRYFP